MGIEMKYYVSIFALATIIGLLFKSLHMNQWITYVGSGALILGLILSGTLVSGDRMRANAQSDTGAKEAYVWYLFVFAIPFLLLMLFG